MKFSKMAALCRVNWIKYKIILEISIGKRSSSDFSAKIFKGKFLKYFDSNCAVKYVSNLNS